jgi:hypothetical protein
MLSQASLPLEKYLSFSLKLEFHIPQKALLISSSHMNPTSAYLKKKTPVHFANLM